MTVPPISRPRVHVLYWIDDETIEYGSKHFDLVLHDDPDVDKWKEQADAVMLRTREITADDALKIGPKLRFVGKHGVGTNQIAVKELRERGILTMNAPGVNASSVAELALGLMLTLARDIPRIDRKLRAGEPVTKEEGGKHGFQLTGRTIGIVGGGNIGFAVARMVYLSFGSTIYLYDPVISTTALKRWTDLIPADRFHRVSNVDDMLPHLDVLTLHVPLTDATRDLIGEEQLHRMQPHAILVNTARGGVVNEQALNKALDEGWISGAGIDAYEVEPPSLDNYPDLIRHERVVSLPHIGAACNDVIRLTALSVFDHLADAFSGKPRDVVEG